VTHQYRAVSWNRHKRVYDAWVAGAVVLAIGGFAGASIVLSDQTPDPAVVVLRSLGLASFALLHVVLCIGPLARLSDRFAPLLYNRRHLGVATFLLGLAHAVLVFAYYGGFGATDPFTAVLFAHRSFGSVAEFPYELLGFAALLILFVMAATSHDFWLAQLSPRAWKAIHMGVYAAYALLVAHVALGGLRDHPHPVWIGLFVAGVACVGGLHAVAGVREVARDSAGLEPPEPDPADPESVPWVPVGTVDEIPERRAKVVCLQDAERVAVFRNDGRISAVTNVCAHQGGPLGEGKVVDGCITCPWHGYQYDPADGRSPPPFTEKIATYRVRVEGREIYLDPRPLPPGTASGPAIYEATPDDETLFEPVNKTLRTIDDEIDLDAADPGDAAVHPEHETDGGPDAPPHGGHA
jgi:sulfoxide reductase heme-binding subunit YedZ